MFKVPIYKAEVDACLAEAIQESMSVAYLCPLEPVRLSEAEVAELTRSIAAKEERPVTDFDLYPVRDILVTTGKNNNRDVFDRYETWVSRHTPVNKPFNFQHKPLEIIGHITSSEVYTHDMSLVIPDDTAIDDLPDQFHIVNNSVLYMMLANDERKEMMRRTVAEIEQGKWCVSMECLFRGFDYGVEGPDGIQRVIARNSQTAFLTKHLSQYKGSGVYVCPETKIEFALSRIMRNITFSGKGLVDRPGNPFSRFIHSSTAAFVSEPADLGYLRAGAEATSISKTVENIEMAETNSNEQALQRQLDDLQQKFDRVNAELSGLKSKDTETTIANLRTELSSRDTVIAEKDRTIASQKTQLDAIKESQTTLTARAEQAETALASASEELKTVKTAEQKRARESVLREKHAPEAAIAKLIDRFAVLDDAAFTDTVETLAASWKKPEVKTDKAKTAIQNAKPEPEPTLATAGDQGEERVSQIRDFFSTSLASARPHARQTASTTK